jgi:hypothetical protein
MNNRFLGDLIAQQHDDGYHWTIYEPFTYRIGAPDGCQYVSIGKGFITDFASIPRGLWNLFPPAAGKYSKAAVVHDCLYKTGYVSVVGRDDPRPMTRAECDLVFLEAMEVAGVNWLSRMILYAGVRIGGWRAWGQHRKADACAA